LPCGFWLKTEKFNVAGGRFSAQWQVELSHLASRDGGNAIFSSLRRPAPILSALEISATLYIGEKKVISVTADEFLIFVQGE
jgi:hypothetical protein